MALLQVLLSLIGRWSGKILNAVFGWAVTALFGRTSTVQQTILAGVVAMAALWPLLLIGIAAPRFFAFLLAFVPLSEDAPENLIRAVWIALALVIPATVGLVVARKAPPAIRGEPFLQRVVRGYPVTLGLAGAFFFMFLLVPALRLVSAFRRWSDEHVPLITEGNEYQEAAAKLDRLLASSGLEAARSRPPWHMTAPSRILKTLGGRAFHGYVPDDPAYWEGPALQITLHPSDVLVRGAEKRAAFTHGLVSEAFASGPGLQTFDEDAQALERRIQRIWAMHGDRARASGNGHAPTSLIRDLARDLVKLDVDYDEWQILYRKIGQLARAMEGELQLLESIAPREVQTMDTMTSREKFRDRGPYESASTRDLLGSFMRDTIQLFKKEAELAKAEVRETVRNQVAMVVGFAMAAVLGLVGVGLLAAALVLGLSEAMAPWLASLLVGLVLIGAAALMGTSAKSKGIKKPFERTQKNLKEDMQWVREKIA
jgi:hypothetical protein